MAQIADTFIESIRAAQCARIFSTLDGEASAFKLERIGDGDGPTWEALVTSAATGVTESFRGADVADCLAQAATWLNLEPSPRPALELA